MGAGEVAAGDHAEPQVDVGHQVGGDGELPRDQQPGHERAGLADSVRLLPQRQSCPPAGPVELRAERAGCLGGGSTGLAVEPLHRRQVLLEQLGGGSRQSERRRHHWLPMLWASMASQARRYSPASQSLARCK